MIERKAGNRGIKMKENYKDTRKKRKLLFHFKNIRPAMMPQTKGPSSPATSNRKTPTAAPSLCSPTPN